MPSIFVSFRKVDNRWMRDRAYQALTEAFGVNEVFKSGESIPAGSDFGVILRRQAAECKVMLVLIGTAWSDARDAGGGRLLDRQDDWVRVEIATALEAGNLVIPVLLGDAAMLPAPVALPDDIAGLAHLQFLRVPETHLDDGLCQLVTAVSNLVPGLSAPIPLSTLPAGPAEHPSTSTVTQTTGGGNAVSVLGGAKNARIAGRDNRETKVHTGGLLAAATRFLTTKAGLVGAAVVVIATITTVVATTSSGGSSGTGGTTPTSQATTSAAPSSDPLGGGAAAQLSPQLPSQTITGITDTFSCQLMPSISQVLPTIENLINESGQKYVFTTAVRSDVSFDGFVVDTDQQLDNYVGRFQLSTYAFKDGDPCYLIAIPFDPSAFPSEGTAMIGMGEMKGAVIIDKATVTTVTG